MKNQFLRILTRSLFTIYFALNTSGTLCAQTVTIGSQVWMVKNLDVARFRNGDAIPEAKSSDAWNATRNNQQPAWCWYDNDPANGAKFGRLYNWYAVADPRGLCPAGWHVPSDEEWTVLEDFLGGRGAGTKLKAAEKTEIRVRYEDSGGYYEQKSCPNCADWSSEYARKVPCHTCKDKRWVKGVFVPKSKERVEKKVKIGWDGDNSSGFTGLPGGCRFGNGTYTGIGGYGGWWSSTDPDASSAYAWFRELGINDGNSKRSNTGQAYGFSVRCLRD